MITDAILEEAIDDAVRYLRSRQLPHGQFNAYASSSPDLSRAHHFDSCVFATAVVAQGLTFAATPESEAMRRRCFDFLLSEMSAEGLWRYWTAGTGKGISPDMDDTSFCSFVLRNERPDLPALNRSLVLANRSEEGLFRTWFRSESAPNDVDAVVNANVILYVGDSEEGRAAARVLARKIGETGGIGLSWYYPDPIALFHALSRAIAHGVTPLAPCGPLILEQIRARQLPDGSFGDALVTSLGLAALLVTGSTDPGLVEPAAAWLLRAQTEEGGWDRCAFYTGPEAPAPRSIWFGSEDVTTAAAIEALARFRSCGRPWTSRGGDHG